jgi:UDP-glucose 4-epimerase
MPTASSPVHVITGGAGFVAVNLARRLLAAGGRVVALDDLSRGRLSALAEFQHDPAFAFHTIDCSDGAAMKALFATIGGMTDVWHLAANSDIPAGIEDPAIDLERTFLTTVSTLTAMRSLAPDIPALHFASSSAIYGDLGMREIVEDIGPLEPISNYGAMKLASEAQIRAAVEAYLPRADIFRFPNVIGVPATHGVIMDFMAKLRATPDRLDVLGDGTQQKAYLHVDDLVEAMLHIAAQEGRYLVYNIGPTDDGVTVRWIAETVRDHVAPSSAKAGGAGSATCRDSDIRPRGCARRAGPHALDRKMRCAVRWARSRSRIFSGRPADAGDHPRRWQGHPAR